MNRTNRILLSKYGCYALLLLVLYLIQTVPGLFVLFGAKPVWIFSAVIAIAMVEDELVGGIYGALGGLLCDLGGFSLFGYNGFFLCLFCVAAGLMVIYLMHNNVWTCMLFTLVTALCVKGLEYHFAYGIWNYSSVWKVYVFSLVPVIAYSVAIAPICYLLVRKMHERFGEALR